MKTTVTILIFVLFGLESFAQRFAPIREYNESGYSVNELKSFATGGTEYQNNFYQALLDIVNDGIRRSGRDSKLVEFPLKSGRHDDWLFSHIVIKDGIILEGFLNSGKNGNQITFFWDEKVFRGSCFVFTFDGLEITIAKTICMNLLKIPIVFANYEQKNPEPEIVPEKEIVPDRSFVPIKPKPDNYVAPKIYFPKEEQPLTKKKIKIWKVIVPVGAILATVAALLLHPHHTTVDNGGPAGAPGYPANPGGPSGAPGYGH